MNRLYPVSELVLVALNCAIAATEIVVACLSDERWVQVIALAWVPTFTFFAATSLHNWHRMRRWHMLDVRFRDAMFKAWEAKEADNWTRFDAEMDQAEASLEAMNRML